MARLAARGAEEADRVSFFSYAWDWVTTSANWQGSDSIPQQILAHLGYCILPLLLAALIGIPAGCGSGTPAVARPSW